MDIVVTIPWSEYSNDDRAEVIALQVKGFQGYRCRWW